MAQLVIKSIKLWGEGRQVQCPMYNPQDFDTELDQELHSRILTAFDQQTKIGWAHFLCRQISKAWKPVIAYYYRSREPGEIYSPDLWM